MRSLIRLALVLAFLSYPAAADAVTYYVNSAHGSASDANAGTDSALPWRTLHRAVDGISTNETGGSGGPYTPATCGDTVIVSSGTYTDNTAAGSPSATIKYNPTNSCTAGNPLTFEIAAGATVTVGRNLDPGDDWRQNPVIGCGTRNYITWKGFTLAAGTDARANNSTGCILDRLTINKGGASSPGSGNYVGIYIDTSTDTIVRNTTISNIYDTDGSADQNGACVMSYDSTGTLFHNNRLDNCDTAIFDKRNGTNNIYEKNYITDANQWAIYVNTENAAACGTCPVSGLIFRYNVVYGFEAGIRYIAGNSTNAQIYNNTFLGTSGLSRLGFTANPESTGASPRYSFYNNIVIVDQNHSNSSRGHQQHDASAGPPSTTEMLSNYNNYYGLGGASATFQPQAGGTIQNLATWDDTGHDVNSITSDPAFSASVSPPAAVTAFRLDAMSAAINAGRTGGTSGGSAVNMGAYLTDNDEIGPSAQTDVTDPVVTITTPTSDPTYGPVSSTPISIAGSCTDAGGVSSVTWVNAAGGSGTASGTTSWSANVGLTSGSNAVTVTCTDTSANDSTDVITVTYTPPGGTGTGLPGILPRRISPGD